jgi:transcriptional regulator with XRE-family HTH domain
MAKTNKGATRADSEPGAEPANNVRRLREIRKWTQWQLAKISKLSERTIQRVESGGRLGTTAEMALAGAFGIEITDLYRADLTETVDFMFLKRIISGNSLLDLVERSTGGGYEVDDLHDSEISCVREFIESLNVWVLMWKDKEPAERVTARHIFTSTLAQRDSMGLWVFAGPAQPAPADAKVEAVKIAVIRSSNPRIIQPAPLRQLGNEMSAIIADVAPRVLDRRLFDPGL